MNENQNEKKSSTWAIGVVIAALVFASGVYIGSHRTSPIVSDHPKAESSVVSEDQFSLFWKAWAILDDKYVDAASTTVDNKVYGAIKGLAASTGDPYTVFFNPEESAQFKNDISGNFEGVGMEIGIKDGVLTVISPIKGNPAEKAGIKAGDKIIKIDDTPTSDLTVEKGVKLIRGPKGTPVRVTIVRDGVSGVIEKTLIRDVIDIPTVETEQKNGVFIIRLFTFTAQSPNLFRNALRQFIGSGTNKLILDLRGNPGGYLDAAWDMASWFLPAGKLVVTEDFGKNSADNNVFRSKGYNIFTNQLKMVILVDAGSASASEILAGALKEHGIAKLVGTKTYGKGSVQELIQLSPDTSLKVTVARWLTPLGHNLSHDGLEPDVEVKITQKDLDAKKDPQMEKAIEVLNTK